MRLEIERNGERLIVDEKEVQKDDTIFGYADWDYDISDEQGLV